MIRDLSGVVHRDLIIFFFLRLHQWPKKVPRLGVTSELETLAYATAMPDLRFIFNLHRAHSNAGSLTP